MEVASAILAVQEKDLENLSAKSILLVFPIPTFRAVSNERLTALYITRPGPGGFIKRNLLDISAKKYSLIWKVKIAKR